jgi:hypothetical protein
MTRSPEVPASWRGAISVDFSSLAGKTVERITRAPECDEPCYETSEAIVFHTSDGEHFALLHERECCESVNLEEVVGDLSDLIGSRILVAEERTNSDEPAREKYDESYTWSFYELRTIKGSVTIRWYGSSNGYYSETAELIKYVPL